MLDLFRGCLWLQLTLVTTEWPKSMSNTELHLSFACLSICVLSSITFKLWRFPLETETLGLWNEWPPFCSVLLPLPVQDGFPCCLTSLIVSHLTQNNLLFWQLGILVMWFTSWRMQRHAFIPNSRSSSRIMILKLANAVLMYFLVFPYMMNVFTIVQALSLGAMECLQGLLLYGFEFRTVKVLMFDLDWYKIHRHIFPSLRIAQTWRNVENETGLQFKVKLTFSSSTGPLFLPVKPQGSCQSKGQPLTMSCPAPCYHSVHLLRQL